MARSTPRMFARVKTDAISEITHQIAAAPLARSMAARPRFETTFLPADGSRKPASSSQPMQAIAAPNPIAPNTGSSQPTNGPESGRPLGAGS